MIIFYFTGTGNSLSIAKRIGGKLISIPQVVDSSESFYKDDAIGIVFPVYGLAMPKMVRRFLEKAQFKANYTFVIGTCGNMAGIATMNAQKLALKNGYCFDYANTIRMVDNYLPMFKIEDEIAKLSGKKLEEKIAHIVEDIRNQKQNQTRGSLALRLTPMTNGVIKYNKFAERYNVNDRCDECGICSHVCPVKNISVHDKVNYGDNCAACLACVHLCPKNAIHIKNEKSNMRWRNPEVLLEEIIAANNRFLPRK